MAQRPSGSKSTRLVKSRTGTLGTSRISVRIILQPHGHQHALNTTPSERQTCLCDTPDPSRPRRLSSPSRDHRPPPSRDTRRSRVLSVLHPNSRRWLPNGHPKPNRLLPRRVQRQRPRHLRSEHILTRSGIHFPWWTRVEPGLARGYDRPVVREWLVVVTTRKHVSIVHGEEWQADVHEWFWSATDGSSAIIFGPGLQTPEARRASLAT